MHSPGRAFLGAAAFAFALLSSTASGSVLWFGDHAGLHQIDAVSNTVVLNVPFETPQGLAVNAGDGSAWVLTQNRIAHVSVAGSILFERAVRDLGNGLGAPLLIVLNPNDGSVWAAFKNALLHFDAAGALLRALPISVQALTVGQDGSVWALGQSSLFHYDAAGNLLGNFPYGATRRMKHIALDDTGGAIWLAGEKEVLKLSLASPSQVLQAFLAPETVSALSADTQSGDLWILGKQGLFSFDGDGVPEVSRDLRDFDIAAPRAMLFDFGSQSVWVGHQRGLSRLSPVGTLLAEFAADVRAGSIAIGNAPVDITPVVAILAPADGALLNDSTPRLTVGYDALCGSSPCGFPNSFFSTFTLSALLNGVEVGSSFVFEAATGTASFTPSTPLPEGANTLTAKATDSFGHESATVSVTFTIDTIAPEFGPVQPPTGSSFESPAITISGSVNDSEATVSLGAQSQGFVFNFPVTLVRGLNDFTLIARDPAGNSATLALQYTFEPPNIPPTVNITFPPNGHNVEAPATFEVRADASDSDGQVVRVEFSNNATIFFTDTAFPWAATLSNLGAGSYTLTARAVDNRNGATTSDPVNVTVGPPNALPEIQLLSPMPNTPFSAPASVPVVARASDSDGTIARVEFFRNGVLAATVLTGTPDYAATLTNVPAGSHSITARATDNRGGTRTTVPVTINVSATAIFIDSPAPNASIGGESVLVTGRTTAPANSGVTVNEVIATLDGFGNFFVVVPVTAGANTLTARLTTIDQTVLTASVSVNATGLASPFAVIPSPSRGLAPLPVTFDVINSSTAAATFTFDGFGPFPLPAGSTSSLSLTYPAGVFVSNVVITSPAGTFLHQHVIDSKDEAQMDVMFRAIWSGLNSALAAQDKAGAMRYLNSAAQAKFGPVFDALLPFMPDIVASYSTPAKAEITPTSGEYGVSRMDGDKRRLYLINFMQGADGVWRVDEM
jgi:hypothetical protein